MANDKDFLLKNAVEVGKDIKVTLGSITSSDINLATGNYFADTLAANTTYTLSNAGDVQSFQLEVTGGVGDNYDITASSASTGILDRTAESTSPISMFIGDSGNKFYVLDSNYRVYQYSLSTANDITTATYDSKNFNTGSQDTNPRGLYFTSDGLTMITVGTSNERVYRYTLSTAWDVSTASYTNDFYTVSAQTTNQRGVFLKSDGTKFYITDDGGTAIEEYTMSTAYDISTASPTNTFSLGTGAWNGLSFKPDGTSFFVYLNPGQEFREYSMTTAWDTSTASLANTFVIASSYKAWQWHTWASDGNSFIIYNATDTQYEQYSAAATATVTWPSSIEWAGGIAPSAPANGETDVFTLSTDDGGTSYVGVKTADNLS